MWLLNGGVATIESYADYSDEEIDKHLEFFSQMYNYYTDEQNRLLYMPVILLCTDPRKKCIPVIIRWTEHCGRLQ